MNQDKNRQLMHMLRNGGITNLSEWFEHIVENFCEEQAINERASFDNIKYRFHDDFYKSFLCTVPTLLFKFLIDKGIAYIVKPRPPLIKPKSNNEKKQISWWKKFIENQEWKKFVN